MEPAQRKAPICIAGMHRSGTSMTARLLNLCGVFLGPRDGMLPPQADNPRGFWELQRFVDINEAVLAGLGGAWDRPPAALTHSGFATDPEFAPQRLAALELAAEFRGREPWGFKDPRNSLTLNFWREVLGPISVVICLRNPLDVARSLTARGSSVDSVYRMWEAHYRGLLRDVGDARSIVVHYESFFVDAPAELRRLTGFLGLEPSEANLNAACGSIDESLRRHVATTDELIESDAPASVVELYAELCRCAGPATADGAETTTVGDVLAIRLNRANARLDSLDECLARQEEQLEHERRTTTSIREQAKGWRALAERGEPVRGAWRKMTALLSDRQPGGGEVPDAKLLDEDLRRVVRLYAMNARDDGQTAVAEDLDRLTGRIEAAFAGGRPPGEPSPADLLTGKKA